MSNVLSFIIDAKDKATATLDKIKGKFSELRNDWKHAMDGMKEGSYSGLLSFGMKLAPTLVAAGAAIKGLGQAVKYLGEGLAEAAALETFAIRMSKITGSMDSARASVRALIEGADAIDDLFSTDDLMNAAISLKRLSGGALGTAADIKVLGGAAISTGQSLSSVSQSVGSLIGMITEGAPGWERMAISMAKTGVISFETATKMRKLKEEGKSAGEIVSVMWDEINRSHSGSIEDVRKGMSGLGKAAEDSMGDMKRLLGEMIGKPFSDLWNGIKIGFADSMTFILGGLKDLAQFIGVFTGALAGGASAKEALEATVDNYEKEHSTKEKKTDLRASVDSQAGESEEQIAAKKKLADLIKKRDEAQSKMKLDQMAPEEKLAALEKQKAAKLQPITPQVEEQAPIAVPAPEVIPPKPITIPAPVVTQEEPSVPVPSPIRPEAPEVIPPQPIELESPAVTQAPVEVPAPSPIAVPAPEVIPPKPITIPAPVVTQEEPSAQPPITVTQKTDVNYVEMDDKKRQAYKDFLKKRSEADAKLRELPLSRASADTPAGGSARTEFEIEYRKSLRKEQAPALPPPIPQKPTEPTSAGVEAEIEALAIEEEILRVKKEIADLAEKASAKENEARREEFNLAQKAKSERKRDESQYATRAKYEKMSPEEKLAQTEKNIGNWQKLIKNTPDEEKKAEYTKNLIGQQKERDAVKTDIEAKGKERKEKEESLMMRDRELRESRMTPEQRLAESQKRQAGFEKDLKAEKDPDKRIEIQEKLMDEAERQNQLKAQKPEARSMSMGDVFEKGYGQQSKKDPAKEQIDVLKDVRTLLKKISDKRGGMAP